nr:hypothetical protein [Tanacetum cinerariifolium]
MVDQRTMAELLCAPIEGYAEAIMVPPILAEHFELKHSLINMMTSDQFFGLEKDNPHDHIRWFNKITSTIKYKDVPNSTVKLMLFPFSLAGAVRRWLEKEPPHILRACPHHGCTKLHQLDTFYNALNPTDQDYLNSAVGGNLLERRTKDVLTIIENKSKVHNSRNISIVSQVKSSDANSSSSPEIAELTYVVNQQISAVTTAMIAILKQFQGTPPPASIKAIEEICVTFGGAHPYYQCLTADGNTFSEFWDNIQGYVSAATVNYNQGNSGYRPPGVANQIRPPGFAQPNVQNNENRFSQPQGYNRGNNFNQDSSYQAPIQQNQVVPLKLKNMMARFFQMNTASILGLEPLPSNNIANPKCKLKAITTQSGLVLDGPSVPMPPLFINSEEDERVYETLMDLELDEMYKQKQQDKDDIQIHNFWQMFKQLHINITLADALILISKYQKMFKVLLSNKEKLLELANTPLNENCSAVILKKLPEKLGDPGKFLIPCGFIGKFTFLADFVIVDYESDPKVPLILGRPFLRTARALID